MRKISAFLFLLLLCFACSKTDEERASSLLDNAKEHISNNEWNAAKIVLDSIHQEYPSLVEYRRMADTLEWQIRLFEHERTLFYIDTLLPIKKKELNEMKKDFVFTKDTLYQDFGSYVHRKMQLAYNLKRTYLKPMVDERGVFSLMSQYYGQVSVQHHALTLEAESVLYRSKDPGVYNAFANEDMYAENLLFEGTEATNIAHFIITQEQRTIKVCLKGVRDYSYFLTKNDKEAVIATINFSSIVADCYRLEQERTMLLNEIEKLKRRVVKL